MSTTCEMVPTRLGRPKVEIEGDGPPAVLWHRLFVDSTSWSRPRPLLRDGPRLIVHDGPGPAASPGPPPGVAPERAGAAAAGAWFCS